MSKNSSCKKIWSIFKKELLIFSYTPTLYVCIALFAFLASYLTFVSGRFFEKDEASLASSFFRWHPWLYTFLAPALSMRLWSEEYRQKTIELLLTMGFRSWHLVMGKFLASWLVLLAALALTFPIVITVYYLGPPDTGAIIAGYLGSALLSGTFLSISIAAASLSRNQFLAYVLGAWSCSLLLLLGSVASAENIIQMFSKVSWLAEWATSLSFSSHYKHFLQGVVPLGGILYFLSTSLLGLYCAHIIHKTKRV